MWLPQLSRITWITLPTGTAASMVLWKRRNSWVPVAVHAAAEHGAFEHVVGGEQRGDAVAQIVVGQGAGLARLERQPGLGAVEGLDLGLLVDRQDHGMLGRVASKRARSSTETPGAPGSAGRQSGAGGGASPTPGSRACESFECPSALRPRVSSRNQASRSAFTQDASYPPCDVLTSPQL